MIACGSRGRESFDVGPFRAMITSGTDLKWANFAVPTDARFSKEDVTRLTEEFHSRSRMPRLEILRELWPSLPPLLESQGYILENEMPLMVCTPDSFREPGTLGRAALVDADGDLASAWLVETTAFGNSDLVDEARLERRRARIRSGNMLLGVAWFEGTLASSALLMIEDRVAELAAVGTLPDFRRRGLAGDASARAMSKFFRSGGSLVWLSAGDEAAKNAYAKLGFAEIGCQANYSLPA